MGITVSVHTDRICCDWRMVLALITHGPFISWFLGLIFGRNVFALEDFESSQEQISSKLWPNLKDSDSAASGHPDTKTKTPSYAAQATQSTVQHPNQASGDYKSTERSEDWKRTFDWWDGLPSTDPCSVGRLTLAYFERDIYNQFEEDVEMPWHVEPFDSPLLEFLEPRKAVQGVVHDLKAHMSGVKSPWLGEANKFLKISTIAEKHSLRLNTAAECYALRHCVKAAALKANGKSKRRVRKGARQERNKGIDEPNENGTEPETGADDKSSPRWVAGPAFQQVTRLCNQGVLLGIDGLQILLDFVQSNLYKQK